MAYTGEFFKKCKVDDYLGVPLFQGTSIYIYIYISIYLSFSYRAYPIGVGPASAHEKSIKQMLCNPVSTDTWRWRCQRRLV